MVRSGREWDRSYGCAEKTWATAPRLKAMVLVGSMVSGAVKSRSPAPRTTGWTTRRYSSIKPVSTSDRANRAPPWASRYPSERSCLSRVMAEARSPAAIVVPPQSADVSESRTRPRGWSLDDHFDHHWPTFAAIRRRPRTCGQADDLRTWTSGDGG